MATGTTDTIDMRIALLAGAFPKLSETFVLEQIVNLLALGHDVQIFAFEAPDELVQHAAVAKHRLLERTSYLTRARGGVTYHVESAGHLNMVMSERADRWICLIGQVPVDRLMNIADQLRF